jgi:hypothetical protein
MYIFCSTMYLSSMGLERPMTMLLVSFFFLIFFLLFCMFFYKHFCLFWHKGDTATFNDRLVNF